MAGLAALCLGYVLSQFFRAFMAVLTPDLVAELGATKSELALASGMWFLTFALMQFAVGVWLDRFGPRRTASFLLAVFGGAGAFLFAFATSPEMLVVAMGLIGIGCSPVLMASLFVFAHSFDAARFAFLTSVFIGLGSLGNIAGATPLALAAEAFGWRAVVAATGVATIMVAVGIFVLIKDPKRRDGDAPNTGFSGFLTLLRMPVLWPIFPIMIVNCAVAAGIRGLWAGPMLADLYGAGAVLIGQVTFWMALAMTAGSFIYGPLDTLFNTRKWVVVAGTIIGLSAALFTAVAPQAGIVPITVAFVIIGITGMIYGVVMAHAKAFFPEELTGRGITLMNFFAIGGVSVMQIITGQVVSAFSSEGSAVTSYSALFWFYILAMTMTLIIYLWSRDAKPR